MMILAIVAWYWVTGAALFFGLLRRELPSRSAVVFSVLWPIPVLCVALSQLNAWSEAAFKWAVERLD